MSGHYDQGYQPVPQDRRRGRPPPQPVVEDPINLSDDEFFSGLEHYQPLCYGGKGTPTFMVNKMWYISLGCLLVINGLFALVIILFISGSGTGSKPISKEQLNKFILINIAVLILTNITYFLTQFMNPGIRNLSTISDEEYHQEGRSYCAQCRGYRTGRMEHCQECEVCVEDLDHHCGFFSKCIAGWQKFAFYAFLTMGFISFLTLLVTMSSNLAL